MTGCFEEKETELHPQPGFICVIDVDQNSLKEEKRTPLEILSCLLTVNITDVTLTSMKLLIVAS